MQKTVPFRRTYASAAAASLALHAAVILAVVLPSAADSRPRLLEGEGGGCIVVSLVDHMAVERGQDRQDGRVAEISSRNLRAPIERPREPLAAVETEAIEPAIREMMSAEEGPPVFADTGAVVLSRAATAQGSVSFLSAATGASGGDMDGGSVRITSSTPRYRDNPYPHYPRAARMKYQEGLVLVEAEVGADGNVYDVRLKASSGYAALDQSALSAVRDWKFEPGRRMGVPVTMRVDVPVRFVLRE
jgi:TonB family protein